MMNHLRLVLFALVAALALVSCGTTVGGSQDNGADSMQGMNHGGERDQTNESSMAGMDHGQMDHSSGSMATGMLLENGKYSDERFIDAMVPHHQGAVEMALVALKNAEHDEIIQLSENIISTQQAEINALKSIKKEEFGTSEVPMEVSSQQMRRMGMIDPQHLAHREPFDRAFIDAMIPHHQSAIEMAQVASKESENPRIRELARNIISAQEREITQMKQWRQKWYPES